LLVVLKLVMAQSVNYFALPPCLQEIFAAGMSKRFGLNQLFFEGMPPLAQHGPAEHIKLQFRRTDPRFELRPPSIRDILHFTVCVFDLLPQHRHPVIRFLQPQLMLPLQALPHP